MVLIIIGALALIFILSIVGTYNSLINKKNQVENAFGGIDTQLKKRYDLIPNLVATVKEYAKHEKSVLENITELRSKAVSGNLSTDEKVDIDNQISKAVSGLMVAVESYPDLKANENFIHLQRNMTEIESQISASRRAYNSAITDYNNGVESFPSSIIAGFMKLTRKPVFEIPQVQRENVDVSNLFNN